MTAILEKLTLYWAYPFVRYALVVGVLIALCSSLLGVTLVLKRFSFIGDGLSHVAFGAMAIAAVLQITNEMPLVMVITIISAVLLLRTGQNTKIKGDAAIAMISVGALAIGYLLMNLFSTSSNLSGDVCSTLFGSTSILTLTKSEVWLCAVLSVAVVAVFACSISLLAGKRLMAAPLPLAKRCASAIIPRITGKWMTNSASLIMSGSGGNMWTAATAR